MDHEWTRVSAIRELSDGRLIVLDTHDNVIMLVDAGLGSARPIGRQGQGPGEFESPTALLWLGNDSTGVLDVSSRSLKIITPQGTPGGILYPQGGAPCGEPGDTLRRLTISADHDAVGRFYQLASNVRRKPDGTYEQTDAAAIERWGARCGRDTVAYIPRRINPDAQIMAGGVLIARPGRTPVFTGGVLWAVAPDGRVSIAHPDPYRIEMVSPTGVRTLGPVIAYQPIRVTEAHKRAWRELAQRPQPVSAMTRDGVRSRRMMAMPFQEPEEWAATLPPFLYPALSVGRDGRLWVQRTTEADAPPAFDVFNSEGRLIERVTLPARSRLVGHGRGVVYLVRIDEDDLEYLERHRLTTR